MTGDSGGNHQDENDGIEQSSNASKSGWDRDVPQITRRPRHDPPPGVHDGVEESVPSTRDHNRTPVLSRTPRPPEADTTPSGGVTSPGRHGWDHEHTPILRRQRVIAVSPSQRPVVDTVAHIHLVSVSAHADVIVRWRYADTTVGELGHALLDAGYVGGADLATGFSIGGTIRADTDLLAASGIVDGVIVTTIRSDIPTAGPDGAVALSVLSGLDCGDRAVLFDDRYPPQPGLTGSFNVSRLADGRYSVSSPNNTPATAPTVASPGRRTQVGSIDVVIDAVGSSDRHALAGANEGARVRIPYERPPYSREPRPVAITTAPVRNPVHASSTTLAMLFASALLPAITGLAIFVVTQSPLSLVLVAAALLGPFITSAANRRANKVLRRNADQTFSDDLQRFKEWLVAQQAVETSYRERRFPDAAAVLRRAESYSSRLWQRRSGDPDFLQVLVGYGSALWDPPVPEVKEQEVRDVVVAHSLLADAAVSVDLTAGSLGFCGRRSDVLAVTRSVVMQLVSLHGPADVELALIADEENADDWDWLKWLPHSRRRSGGGLAMTFRGSDGPDRVGSSDEVANYCLQALPANDGIVRRDSQSAATMVVVIDAPKALHHSATGAIRRLTELRHPNLRLLFVSPELDQIPASCTAVVGLSEENSVTSSTGSLRVRGEGEVSFRPIGYHARGETLGAVDRTGYLAAARSLSRFEDPAQVRVGGGLPATVRLMRLLGLEGADEGQLVERWASADTSESLVLRLGVGEDGPVDIDFVADGPHALIGGTTGSGKSELLSALVAAAAAAAPPNQVRFLLFDFKGGATFQFFERLPHVVKVVSDLDASLADRALVLLHAELDYRKRLFAGVSDIREYRRVQRTAAGAQREDVPRLIVIIDEFGEMKNHVADYDQQLASVARIGRSLGVHLVLSTQTPSESVKPVISDNARIRLALRLQNAGESNLLLGSRDAADIPNALPGRVIGRFGDRTVLFQSPFATAPALDMANLAPVDIGSFSPATFGGTEASFLRAGAAVQQKETEVFVQMARDASERRLTTGSRSAALVGHEPWVDELPTLVELHKIRAVAAKERDRGEVETPPVMLLDNPSRQKRTASGWSRAFGNLLILGGRDSGKTTALSAVLAGEMFGSTPDELTIYALEPVAGAMSEFAGDDSKFVATVITLDDSERVMRLLEVLGQELQQRLSSTDASRRHHRIILAVDGYTALFRLLMSDQIMAVRLTEIFMKGPPANIHTLVTCDRLDTCGAGSTVQRFPPVWEQAQKWILRTTELVPIGGIHGVLTADEARDTLRAIRTNPPGRVYALDIGLFGQVAGDGLAACKDLSEAAPSRSIENAIASIEPLPSRLYVDQLPAVGRHRGGWQIPAGIGVVSGAIEWLDVPPSAVLLVAGPKNSGRSSTLAALAHQMAASGNLDAFVAINTGPGSWQPPGADTFAMVDSTRALEQVLPGKGSRLLVIDDAEAMLSQREFGEAVGSGFDEAQGSLILAASVTYNALNRLKSWWLRNLVADHGRVGVLLRPGPTDLTYLDGITFGERSRGNSEPAGRGYLINSNESARMELVLLPLVRNTKD